MAGKVQDEQSRDDAIISDINIIPLVDIVLVLLIIFMVTATLITGKAIKVELPKAATGEEQEASTLWITMNKDMQLYLNGKPTDEKSLALAVRKERTAHPDVQAILTIDSAVPHGKVIRLIDLIRLAGVGHFSFNVMPEEEGGGRE